MFKYWKKIDTLHHHNRLLLAFISLLVLINITLTIAFLQMPKRFEFWLSPKMSANGGLMKSGEVSKEYVQGFVSSLMPTILSWSSRGKTDFDKNIQSFHYYFTPRHEHILKQVLSNYSNAKIFNRTQIASLYRFMEPSDIRQIGPDTWEVKLILRLTQRLKNESSMVIADKIVAYHLRVVKTNLSRIHNPFQLALDGYTRPEKKLKDLLVQPEEVDETF